MYRLVSSSVAALVLLSGAAIGQDQGEIDLADEAERLREDPARSGVKMWEASAIQSEGLRIIMSDDGRSSEPLSVTMSAGGVSSPSAPSIDSPSSPSAVSAAAPGETPPPGDAEPAPEPVDQAE